MSTPAQVAARRLVRKAGPLPDHLVQTIGRQLARADRPASSPARTSTAVPA